MRTEIGVQDPESYAVWPLLAMGAVVLLVLGYLIITKLMKFKPKPKQPKPVVQRKPHVNVSSLKSKYIAQLDEVSQEFVNENISLREGFQRMSSIIRHFVYEAEGIKVQNYTLEEIRAIGLPILDELVTEYYNPEFARMSRGDFVESMLKTKRVIEQWK